MMIRNFLLIFLLFHIDARVSSTGEVEPWAASLDDNEKLALEAIRSLHRQLDDDQDGNINLDESNDFLREELKYERDYEKRQKAFHQNNDNQVTVRELWETWVKSEVHNWTVEQTVEWLSTFVGLPQYLPNFTEKSVNGTFLPILAVNHQQFLSSILGVKDMINTKKISLKAQDVVLFGPPKEHNNHVKDVILTTLLAIAILICWFIFVRYKSSQRELIKMVKDMEGLAKAEKELMDLQSLMEKSKAEQEKLSQQAEDSLRRRNQLDDDLPAEEMREEVGRLRGEVEVLRNELQRAEVELQDKCWVPPPALQHWLQLTYELELKSYNKKKQSAERQLRQAKDACDKLKKKRSSLMGAFVSTHGKSIDDVDKAILEAKTALTEITHELQERMHRWKQIEMLVSSPIVNNPGLHYLETVLRGYGKAPSYGGPGSVISNSQDDIDDDATSSIYCPSAVHKLVSTSRYLMFPAGPPTSSAPSSALPSSFRLSAYQQQGGGGSSNNGGGGSGTSSPSASSSAIETLSSGSREKEGLVLAHAHRHSIPHCQSSLESTLPPEPHSPDHDTVSAPATTSNHHMPMIRSKSVTSMLSLRDRANKDMSSILSNEEDNMPGEASEMVGASGRDRRVTFGIRPENRNGKGRPESFPVTFGRIAPHSNGTEVNGLERKLNFRKPLSSLAPGPKPEGIEQQDVVPQEPTTGWVPTEKPDLIQLPSPPPPLKMDGGLVPDIPDKNTDKHAAAWRRVLALPIRNMKILDGTEKAEGAKKAKSGVWRRISRLVPSTEAFRSNKHYRVKAIEAGRAKIANEPGQEGMTKLGNGDSSTRHGHGPMIPDPVPRKPSLFQSFRTSAKNKGSQTLRLPVVENLKYDP